MSNLHGWGPINPPRKVSGEPARLSMMDVVTVNSDATVELRSRQSRASRGRVPVLCRYAPTVGDRVVVAELDGDPQNPAVIAVMHCTPPTITGSRASGAALVNLLAALEASGFIIDNTTP